MKLLYLPLPVFEVSFLKTSDIWNLLKGKAKSKYLDDTKRLKGADKSYLKLIFLSLSSNVNTSPEVLFKSSAKNAPMLFEYSNGLVFISW